MTSRRFWRWITPLLLIGLSLAAGAVKKHPPIGVDQECLDCHAQAQEAWQSGKHGAMGVQCVVCHGSLDATFFRQPPLARCNGCHAAQVADLRRAKLRQCTSCHDRHTLVAKVKKPFHGKGGKR